VNRTSRISGLRSQVTAATERAGDVAATARQRSRTVDTAFLTYERDRRAAGGVLAGAVAFRLFAYLLPLFLGLLALIGALAGLDDSEPRDIGRSLGMSSFVLNSVETAVRESRRSLWILVPLALWAIYTAGLGAAKVLHAVHALAWDQPIERVRSSPAAAGGAFLVAVVAVVLIAGLQLLREHAPGVGLTAALVGVLPFTALWLVVSLHLPHDPAAPWTAFLPGALLMGASVWLGHLVSSYWLAHRIHSASQMYGSLGVAAAILAWLYLFGRVIVAAAMLNATLWQRRRPAPPATSAPEAPEPLDPPAG
jgi:uncharacterized BrkB/YihY/UPF0761 family membrane protein